MREWRMRRTGQPHPDGQRRWDRTYQQLIAWTQVSQDAAVPAGPESPAREVNHEDRDLCTGLHPAPGAGRRAGSAD